MENLIHGNGLEIHYVEWEKGRTKNVVLPVHSHILSSPSSLVQAVIPLFSHWFTCFAYPHSVPPNLATSLARALPCPMSSCVYPKLSTHCLLITLTTKAISSSEISVNIYQTTLQHLRRQSASHSFPRELEMSARCSYVFTAVLKYTSVQE
jgi:hypothetical protein